MQYVIIGASAAGLNAALLLRVLDPQSTVICITDEIDWPYNRCWLSYYLNGSKKYAQLSLITPEALQKSGITLLRGKTITTIDVVNKEVSNVDNSLIVAYDRLLLATGATQFIPPFYVNYRGVRNLFLFYTLADVTSIRNWLTNNWVVRVVVIGAGITGLECIDSLLHYNIEIVWIDEQKDVLSHCVNHEISQRIKSFLFSKGVTIYTEQSVNSVRTIDGVITNITLYNGISVAVDMVIVTAGVIPRTELARSISLTLAPTNHSILVDSSMRTSNQDIYAAGDVASVWDNGVCVSHPGYVWAQAVQQGVTAARVMAGSNYIFKRSERIRVATMIGDYRLVVFFSEVPMLLPINNDNHIYVSSIVMQNGGAKIMIFGQQDAVLHYISAII